MRVLLLFVLLLVGHLGLKDKRRGSHRQKTHGTEAGTGVDGPKARRRRTGKNLADAYAKPKHKKPIIPDDDPFDDDDPFAEAAAYEPPPLSKEEEELRKYEERLLRDMEKQERSKLHAAVLEAGGLQTRDELREEYREIPNTYKRRDGMPGDEMAEYLSTYYPELGIEDERDLIDYLAS